MQLFGNFGKKYIYVDASSCRHPGSAPAYYEKFQRYVEAMQQIVYKKMCFYFHSVYFPYRNSAHRYHPGNPQQCCIFHFPVDTPSPRPGIHSLRSLKDLSKRKGS